ncbi:MAG: TMEM43 family protein, partial [Deltaproteobacteria bacterium]|nr:TMEM43 family protein [Deltaproteobacteria bacterium]
VTIVAAQSGDALAPFQTKAGDALAMLKPGTHTAAAMFAMAHSENVFLTWILRVVGFLCLLFGLRMVLAPLAVAGDVLPILGSLMRLGITFVAFSLALPLSLLTVAAAWLFYRPVLAGILIASGVAAVVLVKLFAAKRRPAAAASAAVPS